MAAGPIGAFYLQPARSHIAEQSHTEALATVYIEFKNWTLYLLLFPNVSQPVSTSPPCMELCRQLVLPVDASVIDPKLTWIDSIGETRKSPAMRSMPPSRNPTPV